MEAINDIRLFSIPWISMLRWAGFEPASLAYEASKGPDSSTPHYILV